MFFDWCRKNKHKCYIFGGPMMIDDIHLIVDILEKKFKFSFCKPFFHDSYEDNNPSYRKLCIIDKIKKKESSGDVVYINMLPNFTNDAFSVPRFSFISVPRFNRKHILYKNRTINDIIQDDIKGILSSPPVNNHDNAWKSFVANIDGRENNSSVKVEEIKELRQKRYKGKKFNQQSYKHIFAKLKFLKHLLNEQANDLKKLDVESEQMIIRVSETLKEKSEKIARAVEMIKQTNEPIYIFLDLDQTIMGESDFELQGMTSFCSLDPEACKRTMTRKKAYEKNKEFVRQSIRPNFEQFIAYVKEMRQKGMKCRKMNSHHKSREIKVFIVSAGMGTNHVIPRVNILEDILDFSFDRPIMSRSDLHGSGKLKDIPNIMKELKLWDENIYDRSVILIDDNHHHQLYTKKLLLIPEYELRFSHNDVFATWAQKHDHVWEDIVQALRQVEKNYGTLVLTRDIISSICSVLLAPKSFKSYDKEIDYMIEYVQGKIDNHKK